ncbi:MAG: glycosyltransferase family 2 protein [Bacteroidales bacterium]|nr:glycosyltransferase family 2 protein [Bacteroidales bacterium]
MISVCLATYNGEKFLREQLDSILCQLSENDEIVISDDSSTDGTREIIKSYNDRRIKLYINNGKHGYVTNFENAFVHSNGEYIFLSDQDDIWLPNKIDAVMQSLKSFDLVMHDANIVNGNGQNLGKTFYSIIKHRKNSFIANWLRPRFLGCCMAFNRNVLEKALPMTSLDHDYWIGMLALYKFKVVFLNDALINYRRHGNNVSSTSEKNTNSLYHKLSKRFKLIVNLFARI